MKVNTYGLTMRGLKKAAGETIRYTDRGHVQISYDTETGDVLTDWHSDANSWSSYHKTSIIGVVNAYDPMTMQAIADAVRDAVGRWETWC